MTALSQIEVPKHKMTVDEFLAWSETVPGRYELHDGYVALMQSERAAHARVKARLHRAFQDALTAAGRDKTCESMPDGMTVRIDDKTAYEPNALIYCGERLPPDAVEVASPIVIVEVLSPSATATDKSRKIVGYFQMPSVMHYIIVDPLRLPVVHHARQSDGTILTRLVANGVLDLNPPGIHVPVNNLLAAS